MAEEILLEGVFGTIFDIFPDGTSKKLINILFWAVIVALIVGIIWLF